MSVTPTISGGINGFLYRNTQNDNFDLLKLVGFYKFWQI
jgi:hypothetical protein